MRPKLLCLKAVMRLIKTVEDFVALRVAADH